MLLMEEQIHDVPAVKKKPSLKTFLSEYHECKIFLQLLPDKYKNRIIHIPNEGLRSLGYAKKLKNIGLRPGVSDYFFAIPTEKYGGLWLEMKSQVGKASKSQMQFIQDMRTAGYAAYVVHGGENAYRLVNMYMTGQL